MHYYSELVNNLVLAGGKVSFLDKQFKLLRYNNTVYKFEGEYNKRGGYYEVSSLSEYSSNKLILTDGSLVVSTTLDLENLNAKLEVNNIDLFALALQSLHIESASTLMELLHCQLTIHNKPNVSVEIAKLLNTNIKDEAIISTLHYLKDLVINIVVGKSHTLYLLKKENQILNIKDTLIGIVYNNKKLMPDNLVIAGGKMYTVSCDKSRFIQSLSKEELSKLDILSKKRLLSNRLVFIKHLNDSVKFTEVNFDNNEKIK